MHADADTQTLTSTSHQKQYTCKAAPSYDISAKQLIYTILQVFLASFTYKRRNSESLGSVSNFDLLISHWFCSFIEVMILKIEFDDIV